MHQQERCPCPMYALSCLMAKLTACQEDFQPAHFPAFVSTKSPPVIYSPLSEDKKKTKNNSLFSAIFWNLMPDETPKSEKVLCCFFP